MSGPSNDNMGQWIKQQLDKLGQSEAPEMLLNYILLMISNRKTVAEIREELVELLGEDEAGLFTAALELELKRQQQQQQQHVAAETDLAPAPTGAAGNSQAKELSSAQGGRGKRDRDRDEANSHVREPYDRSRDAKDRRQDNDQTRGDKRMRGPVGGDSQAGQFPSSSSQRNTPPPPPHAAVGGMGGPLGAMGFNPAQMRQQMEAMAQMAGFASADAMMAAQQQMLLSMAAGGRGFSPRGGGGGRTGRGMGDGRLGGRGRGFGGRNAPVAAPAPTVFVPEKARSYVAPHLQEAQKETKKEKAAAKAPPAEFVPKALDEATLASMSAEDRARHTHPAYTDFDEEHEPMGGYGGRGGGGGGRGPGRGGRGGRGRGRGRGWAPFETGLSAER